MAKGLGKGINALFNQVDLSEETVEEIKVADLRPNPYQPRKHFDDEALAELKESVFAAWHSPAAYRQKIFKRL